jgi:hypothetical protein
LDNNYCYPNLVFSFLQFRALGWLLKYYACLQSCKRKGPNWPFFRFSGSHLWLQHGIPTMAHSAVEILHIHVEAESALLTDTFSTVIPRGCLLMRVDCKHWIVVDWVRLLNPIEHNLMVLVLFGSICSIEFDWFEHTLSSIYERSTMRGISQTSPFCFEEYHTYRFVIQIFFNWTEYSAEKDLIHKLKCRRTKTPR